jgi:IS30 family transposase
MDRDQLKRWLDQGLSLPQIGKLVGRDPSTVGYWLQKHGLVANGRAKYSPRGGLTREQLEPLVLAGLTLEKIAAELDRSEHTIRYWIERHGLPKPKLQRCRDMDIALAQGKRTVVRRCRRHGEGIFVIDKSGRVRCRRCRMEAVSEWRRRTKAKLVAEAGGRCRLCGYEPVPGGPAVSPSRSKRQGVWDVGPRRHPLDRQASGGSGEMRASLR